nr:MAG TPA: hypothetical protein [Caudoviricetes sp.]
MKPKNVSTTTLQITRLINAGQAVLKFYYFHYPHSFSYSSPVIS